MLRKILAVTVLSAGILGASNANAAVDGPYLGLQLGWANTHYSTGYGTGSYTADISGTRGFAQSVLAGYQFNENWATEAGYMHFSNIRYKNISGTGVNSTIKQSAIDVAIKGMMPLPNCFGAYAKLGAAYVSNTADAVMGGSQNHIDPLLAGGFSYDVTPNFPVDLSWTHLFAGGGRIPSVDFVAVGFNYNFG